MARRPRLFTPGLLYHVIVRGNQRRKTCLSGADYQSYLERLGRYRGSSVTPSMPIVSCPTMSIVREFSEPLAKFMQGLQSHSQYYNLRHRKPPCVPGRYKAMVCEKDNIYCTDPHIHLNPVRPHGQTQSIMSTAASSSSGGQSHGSHRSAKGARSHGRQSALSGLY
jgi:hypothetical protein